MRWTGNTGIGTQSYGAYGREHVLTAAGKPPIAGSSDPAFRGDPTCWSPEALLVGALSACHQLWYLHLCAESVIVVLAYEDAALGLMTETADGAGQFTEVILRPRATLAAGSDAPAALALHEAAGARCFLARSMAFAVRHDAQVSVAPS